MQEPLVDIVTKINHQVLSMINQYAHHDQVCAQVVFGLPLELTRVLAKLSSVQIERLSRSPICLMTLRNCGDLQYWQRLLKCSEHGAEPHLMNLNAFCMIHAPENRLHSPDRDYLSPNKQETLNANLVSERGK